MTRRDFELIALAIKCAPLEGNMRECEWSQDQLAQAIREIVAKRLARDLASTNPRFNRCRFLAACGVEAKDCN